MPGEESAPARRPPCEPQRARARAGGCRAARRAHRERPTAGSADRVRGHWQRRARSPRSRRAVGTQYTCSAVRPSRSLLVTRTVGPANREHRTDHRRDLRASGAPRCRRRPAAFFPFERGRELAGRLVARLHRLAQQPARASASTKPASLSDASGTHHAPVVDRRESDPSAAATARGASCRYRPARSASGAAVRTEQARTTVRDLALTTEQRGRGERQVRPLECTKRRMLLDHRAGRAARVPGNP